MLRRVLAQVFGRNRTTASAAPPTQPVTAETPPAGSRSPGPIYVELTRGQEGEVPDLWQRPHATLDDLTIIVPILPTRGRFLQTTLEHFRQSRIACRIEMTVNTDAPRDDALEALVASFPDLDIGIQYHPMAVHFGDRLIACAQRATTEYVFVHSDDDFVVPGALADCVDFLHANRDYAACQGRSFFFGVRNEARFLPVPQRFLSREEALAAPRVLQHCLKYTNTFHAVTRREAFLQTYTKTAEHTQQVIFWQYLSSCWLISLGKLKVLDRLFYLRLDNPGGERALLMKRADRSHWPYLVVAPDFSTEQERFKAVLVDAMSREPGDLTLSDTADDCCLGLIRRAFGQPLEFDKEELALYKRFSAPDSHESEVARYCGPRAIEAMRSMQKPVGLSHPP